MRRGVLLVIFVASGMAGLVFEVALQRSLVRWFGVGAWASALVLAAYMAGLAIGALAFGRLADRARSALRLYGALELGVAVWAAGSPWLIEKAGAAFAALALDQPLDAPGPRALRFTFALVLTLAPTVLMGGTLPAMARALEQGGERRETVAQLYTANLLGAGLGALLGAYAVLPGLGLTGTFLFGAALNALAGGAAFLLRPLTAPTAIPHVAPASPASPAAAVAASGSDVGLVALSAWSGFAVFVAEVTWIHLLATVIGCSAYAFGLMLGVLLLALALGGAWLSRLPEHQVDWARVGMVSLWAAAALALTLPLWDQAPNLFVIAGTKVASFSGRELVRALVALEVVGAPAAILGVVYPLVLRMAARRAALGATLGKVAAANTAGAVAGSLLTGFVLLPLLGSRGILLALALGTAALAAALLPGKKRLFALGAAAAALAMPAWNLARLASGTNVYFHDAGYSTGEVEWASESITGGFTSVVRNRENGVRVMLTNGKFQGSNSGEIVAQRSLAQIPALLKRGGDRALLVGIGTGGALNALASQPYAQVDAVELVEDVTAAARKFFTEVNGGVLDSPRVRVIHADGRNLLLLSSQRYEVISMQLSSVWFAGAADLYNRDFYRLVRARLSPGGVLQQWMQLHHATPKDLAVMLETLRAEFKTVALFVRGGQGIALATDGPFELDYPALKAFAALQRGKEAVAGLPAGELVALANALVLDPEGVSAFVEDQARQAGVPRSALVSTDDNLFLEYSTPRGNVLQDASAEAMLGRLSAFAPEAIPWKGAPEWVADELAALAAIERGAAGPAALALQRAQGRGAALPELEAAIAALGSEP